ncbi:ABC transporter permease [Olavius algarvensis spirochete endosymbiont]|uniref:ABC transporter permease n=1 Tax=Olavius algarvensis spirochete endosymbiont TaxID=260710 RepID=UPI001E54D0A9|nr:ABC transporter permease [Olavius algarvensis spirochete endosymbiont]
MSKEESQNLETLEKSLTYWQDAWRRLKKHKLAMAGLAGVISTILFAVLGPFFSRFSYSDQILDYARTPPRLDIYEVADDYYVFLTKDYNLLRVSEKGEILERIFDTNKDLERKAYTYFDARRGLEIELDFSYNLLPGKEADYNFTLVANGGDPITEATKTVFNRTYPFGSDSIGRSILVRVMYGARISLIVAFVASLANLLIGAVYGSIAGYEGGRTDILMMRFVDILNSIPLLIYVILIMVLVGNRGLWTMIIALGSVYWVTMARLVRGQVLSLKGQEFVLAARALGVKKRSIISRHLIPNTIGPIIISMTMMIPRAIFTEAFLSFIGLGVSAPMASWGTLTEDALSALLSFPYQLFFPSMAIAITMLSFNFLGDGLRDALDPRLRKG